MRMKMIKFNSCLRFIYKDFIMKNT